ncbi:DUF3887 domain-containing protein [candidate division WOR-3 bacterium]|nr:DUF3887 domain-containing protein [candidate division WOR-3 bacterium]
MRLLTAMIAVLVVSFVSISCAARDVTGPGREFVEMLVRGDYAAAVAKFDATMKGVMPEAELSIAWLSLLQQAGPFQQIAGVSQTKEQGHDVAYVRCDFEKTAVNVKVVYNANMEVAGLWFVP